MREEGLEVACGRAPNALQGSSVGTRHSACYYGRYGM